MAINRGFTPEWLDELKRKNDIVSVVSKYVQLEQRGSKFWGCCPFHHEKTPSFCVDPYEGLFHCFGCKEGGDLISFVQKIESCDFHEAITRLAENAKMPLPELVADDSIIKRKKEKDSILKVLDAAYKHYHENLYKPEAKPAQDYIKTRGFTRHELDDFAIGYSFDWNEMINYLLSQGFSKQQLLAAGVAQTKDGNRIYDAMAERLVFPIFNSFGECVAFSARALQKTDFAKYKNTAETPVFQKGKTVFGIHLLKRLKQEKGLENIIIVEGQIDVISMHRGGFKNTVAGLGTAFTADHARELKKLCNNVILCFDGDEAGEKATLRAIDIMRNADMNTKIAVMPNGQDPDEVLKSENGKEKMQKIIDSAKPIMDYYIDSFKAKNDLSKPDGKANFVKSVLERLKTFSQPEQEAYLPKIRDLTNMPIDMLRRNLGMNIMPTFEKKEEKVLPTRINGNKRAENFILASILHKKPFVDKRLDYKKLIDSRANEIDIIDSVSKVSSLFDIVDVENEPFWQDIVYFDFAEVKGSDEVYFNECVWSLAEEKYKQIKDEIMAKYKLSQDLNERRTYLVSAQEVDKKIREKNLEDFYA
ncbi:MAG TPA: DNA primase [Clostridiales bacterium]|nr:DNA primase [Clostridiales bacterium]